MKKIGQTLGLIVSWLGWPILWFYLRRGKRTRMLLVCGSEFLALQGWIGTNKWGMPGGGLHKGEDSKLGALRELREETGVDLTANQVTYVYTKNVAAHGLSFTYDCYTCKLPAKPQVTIQRGEIAEYAWLPLDVPLAGLGEDLKQALVWWKNRG